jgi:predicted ATPase
LVAAIESLQPSAGLPLNSPVSRGHRLVMLRYVDAPDVVDVGERLGLGESQYHRVHHRCFEAIVSLLAASLNDDRSALPDDELAVSAASDEPARLSVRIPYPMTPCIGRAWETEAVHQLLSDARLVTLTGPPGVGKTRLSLEVAAAEASSFPDGVYFIPLGDIQRPTLVASAIARVLALREYRDQPLADQVGQFLRDKTVLLVLDNFEHLLVAAELVARLVAKCGKVMILVTSRAPLRIYGEHEYPVQPLTLPDRARLPRLSPAVLTQIVSDAPAVQLFVERFRAAQPGFALNDENAVTIAEICHQLDGLPLALDLAASRIKLFSLQSLLARPGRRLVLLTRGPADAPSRHQALRGAIDWSYEVLSEAEKAGFRRLAVIVGGFTLEAAEAIVGG